MIGLLARPDAGSGGYRFRKHVKGLAEGRDHFAFFQVQFDSTKFSKRFFARFLFHEQPLGVAG
jgi:hypothetical protein